MAMETLTPRLLVSPLWHCNGWSRAMKTHVTVLTLGSSLPAGPDNRLGVALLLHVVAGG